MTRKEHSLIIERIQKKEKELCQKFTMTYVIGFLLNCVLIFVLFYYSETLSLYNKKILDLYAPQTDDMISIAKTFIIILMIIITNIIIICLPWLLTTFIVDIKKNNLLKTDYFKELCLEREIKKIAYPKDIFKKNVNKFETPLTIEIIDCDYTYKTALCSNLENKEELLLSFEELSASFVRQ